MQTQTVEMKCNCSLYRAYTKLSDDVTSNIERTNVDKILSIFRKILGFDEMECLQIPNMEMGNNRREQLKEARNYLIQENFDRSSYEVHLKSLEDYENQLEVICTDLKRTKEDRFRDEKMAECMAQLKFLRNKFKMRLLLYDLGKFYECL